MRITIDLAKGFVDLQRSWNPITKKILSVFKFRNENTGEEILARKYNSTIVQAEKYEKPMKDAIEEYWDIKIQIKGKIGILKNE